MIGSTSRVNKNGNRHSKRILKCGSDSEHKFKQCRHASGYAGGSTPIAMGIGFEKRMALHWVWKEQ